MKKKEIEQIIERRKGNELLEDIKKELLHKKRIIADICKARRNSNDKVNDGLTDLLMCDSRIEELVDELQSNHKKARKGDR